MNQLTSQQPGWNQYLRYEDNFISGKSTEGENLDTSIHAVVGACPTDKEFAALKKTLDHAKTNFDEETTFEEIKAQFCIDQEWLKNSEKLKLLKNMP